MRSGTSQTIRYNPGAGSAQSARALALVLVALLGTSLAGCASGAQVSSNAAQMMPVDETGPWTYTEPTQREMLLARSDFSTEIVRFTDSRRPRSLEVQSKDQLIYAYEPDELMGGVATVMPGMMGKYLSYRPKMAKHYKVEMDLRKLTTVIKTGTFLSGSWGRYYVEMEFSVIARRPDSTVALQRTFKLRQEQPRKDTNGRGPSKERDRARMFDLNETLIRKAAEQIGWELRQRDVRTWQAPAPQSIRTRLNMPPVDNARGTFEDDRAPMLVPVAIPEAVPADAWVDGPVPDDKGVPAPEVVPPAEGWVNPVI